MQIEYQTNIIWKILVLNQIFCIIFIENICLIYGIYILYLYIQPIILIYKYIFWIIYI